MNKLTIFGQTLRLKGHTKTLELTERHNRRLITSEIGGYGRIDVRRSPFNLELVSLKGPLQDVVKTIISDKGIDLNHYSLQKINRGYAVEFVFTVTSGHLCDFKAMYSDCLDLLKEYYPECPIVHAVIHYDEHTPHMHVVLVPFKDGKLQADKINRYKGESRKRNKFFFDRLNSSYGLTFPVYLKGSQKKRGVELALQAYQSIPEGNLRIMLDGSIVQAIHARPEPFLYALGITYDEVLSGSQTTPT